MASDFPIPYPIGHPGTPWDDTDKATWLSRQRVQRSYAAEVLAPLRTGLPAQAELFQYGVLDYTRFGLGNRFNRQVSSTSPSVHSACVEA